MHIQPVLINLAGETLPTSLDLLIADPDNGGSLGVIGTLEIPRLYEESFVYVVARVGARACVPLHLCR
jgi:hypothetical protein